MEANAFVCGLINRGFAQLDFKGEPTAVSELNDGVNLIAFIAAIMEALRIKSIGIHLKILHSHMFDAIETTQENSVIFPISLYYPKHAVPQNVHPKAGVFLSSAMPINGFISLAMRLFPLLKGNMVL
ncbi:MAG: hypothetical protein HUJ60_01820 [Bacilli bacterium]|nr:hypothetical protein [Bacilli bacterium]